MTWIEEDAKVSGGEAIQMGIPATEGVREKSSVCENNRLVALEIDNLRLTKLVGELLAKNQQLRDKLEDARGF